MVGELGVGKKSKHWFFGYGSADLTSVVYEAVVVLVHVSDKT